MPRPDLTQLHGGVALLLAAVLTALLAVPLGLAPLLSWLLAVSGVTFAIYGFDKRRAMNRGVRVPERVLLGLGFLGGTPGALLGMRVFRHKTVKTSFRVQFILLTVAQVALIAVYLWFLRGKL
jgi:uncharacterized membrane protein YsdA (DUF1294 family)